MPVTIQPLAPMIRNSEDYGRMAFVGDDLVAILVATREGRLVRSWSVEWIAPVITTPPPTFAQIGTARAWLSCEYCKSASKRG